MSSVTPSIPWERRRELGVARAFRDTLVLSIREPRRFYGLTEGEAGVWPAIAYGFTFELAVAIATFLYQRLVAAEDLDRSLAPLYPQLRQIVPDAPEMIRTLTAASAVGSLCVAPFTYLFNLYATAALTWVGLRLARCLHTRFNRIVQLFAYASWIQVFGLLGLTGDLTLSFVSFAAVLGLGSYYWLVIVRESQRIDTRRAVYASLYALVVALVAGCVCGIPVLIAAVYFVVSNLPK